MYQTIPAWILNGKIKLLKDCKCNKNESAVLDFPSPSSSCALLRNENGIVKSNGT
jgi:hypothetical protein